jgi:hypothetical protein
MKAKIFIEKFKESVKEHNKNAYEGAAEYLLTLSRMNPAEQCEAIQERLLKDVRHNKSGCNATVDNKIWVNFIVDKKGNKTLIGEIKDYVGIQSLLEKEFRNRDFKLDTGYRGGFHMYLNDYIIAKGDN